MILCANISFIPTVADPFFFFTIKFTVTVYKSTNQATRVYNPVYFGAGSKTGLIGKAATRRVSRVK